MRERMPRQSRVNRREFIGVGATALAFSAIDARLARGTQANSKIALGMIGCGGRGTWIAELFQNNGGFELVAAADYFGDRVEAFGQKFGIDPSRRYTGLSGAQRLIESKLDGVVIESPPYFHAEQAAAAVAGGRHVYLAKPIAVDVPGCTLVANAGRTATERKQVFLVDFQTRADPTYREAVKRVHYGEIGRVAGGQAVYFCDTTWGPASHSRGEAEARLRAWGSDRALSGDIIVEQNIHALDVATWMIDAAPQWATGMGGRKTRRDASDINDHFALVYGFPNEIALSFSSKQFGQGFDDIGCCIFGSRGTVETHYFGTVRIRGEMPFAGDTMKNLYTDGAVANIAEFRACIANGEYHNATVAPSVRSNLTAILGRMAAQRAVRVTWVEMMQANERLDAELKGLRA